jgi:trimeric autotransporter adhesin
MPARVLLPVRVALVAGLLLTIATSGSFAQQRVGVNAAVNPDATGTPPGAAARKLVVGQDVIFNEHITTAENGQTQLMFLDESAMTIGPNSDLTIDQFVYDPKTGTGKLAMNATRGLLRYVGGKLSKQDQAVTIRTSTATLAVRGGAFILNIDRNGTTEAIFIYGDALTVTGLGGAVETLRRPGFAITIAPGAAPSSPAPVPPGQLAQFTQQLDGRVGRTAGAKVVPTDASVANSGVSQTISGNLTTSTQQAGANQIITSATTGITPTNTVIQPNNAVVNCANTPSAPNCAGVIASAPSPTPPPSGGFAGRIRFTNGQGTSRGFIDESTGGDVAYSGGTISSSGTFSTSLGTIATISPPPVPGTSEFTGTSSTLGPITGTITVSPDGTFFYANITPTNQPSERAFIYGGTPVNPSFYASTAARVQAFAIQPDAALQANIPFLRSQTGGNLPGATVSPLVVATPAGSTFSSSNVATKALQTSLAINGSGANQTSAIVVATGNVFTNGQQPILNGVVNGSYLPNATSQPTRVFSPYVTPIDGAGNSFYGGNSITGFVLSSGNCCGSGVAPEPAVETNTLTQVQTTYGYTPPVIPTSVPSYATGTQTTQTLSGYFGGIMTKQPTGGVGTPLPYAVTGTSSISTSASNLQIAATFTGGDPFTASTSGINATNGLVMQYGTLSNGNTNARQAFINDNLFAAERSPDTASTVAGVRVPFNSSTGIDNSGSNIFMVTQTAAPPPTSLLPSGASYCACQYLQWGYWGGELDTPAGSSTAARIDTGHINFWVAGTPTPLGDLSTLASQAATGTYAGHAIGSVYNNGASYIAAGGFNGTYNFGTQVGTMAINNFDGQSFSATGKVPLNGANYTFAVAQPGVAGSINGTFFGPMAQNTGGNFAIHTTAGPAYIASGIFAGTR